MNHWKRGWMLVCVFLSLLARVALAQVGTTTVQDTVYRADGTPAGGAVVVSWSAFTTAAGQAIPSGTTAITLGAGGLLTVALAPNAGSSPMGSYYTAVYHLNDGTTSREYWVVPVSSVPAKLAGIRNSVLPASVALQTVTKNYVDTAIAAAVTGHPLDASSPYVEKAGDTMTGPLVLPGDPVSANQAADKNYVDTNVAAVAAGLGRKVDELPGTTQVVAQPAGTQLAVNHLNGTLYAGQYVSVAGNDGIANVLASPDCAAHCDVHVEPSYGSTESIDGAVPSQGRLTDERLGKQSVLAVNPRSALDSGTILGNELTVVTTESAATRKALFPAMSAPDSIALRMQNLALTGGNNQLPNDIENVPYFKSTFSATTFTGRYNTAGQHVLNNNATYCYGVGDCLLGSFVLRASGGTRDNADEGAHPFDFEVSEDTDVFEGTCATGCTTGSTALTISATASPQTQGDGRFLINRNPAKVINAGTLQGGARTAPFATASFSGTNFAASTFLLTSVAATSQTSNIAPGNVTLSLATSGVPSGFSTNTAALPSASGVACVAEPHSAGASSTANYEMAAYTVVDGTHLQLTLNKVHAAGAVVAVGGLCGYGLEQTVDTQGNIRQVFPVMGTASATSLYYVDARTAIVGQQGLTSAYLNVQQPISTISRTGGVVTVTVPGFQQDLSGLTLSVSGVADASYNGSFSVSSTSPYTFSYSSSGADSSSSGGTVTLITGGFTLYPMAEVLSVMNPATGAIDGYMQLGANTVPWAAGDAVEQPHFYQEDVAGEFERITQYTPRPNGNDRAGLEYLGNVGPGVRGWTVWNAANTGSYLGNGGTHTLPDTAFEVMGPWKSVLTAQAGDDTVFRLSCNSHGCNKYNSGYALFSMDSATGVDQLTYAPQSSTVAWGLGGAVYSFTPAAFTASTINVNTLNAGTITGGVSGGAINSGTVSAARLPVFGPSGSTHGAGIVPDPGATAGSSRYLREDGTFAVPTGASIANVQIVLPTTAIAANSCTTPVTAAMAGLVSTSTFSTAFASNPNAVAGWGANGGLTFTAWPTTNTLNWSVCNQTAASVTPGAMTLNLGAK